MPLLEMPNPDIQINGNQAAMEDAAAPAADPVTADTGREAVLGTQGPHNDDGTPPAAAGMPSLGAQNPDAQIDGAQVEDAAALVADLAMDGTGREAAPGTQQPGNNDADADADDDDDETNTAMSLNYKHRLAIKDVIIPIAEPDELSQNAKDAVAAAKSICRAVTMDLHPGTTLRPKTAGTPLGPMPQGCEWARALSGEELKELARFFLEIAVNETETTTMRKVRKKLKHLA